MMRQHWEDYMMTAQAHPEITHPTEMVTGRGVTTPTGRIATLVAHLGRFLRLLKSYAAPGFAGGLVDPATIYTHCSGDYHAGLNEQYASAWLKTPPSR